MTLPGPEYVPIRLLMTQNPAFSWDDWDPEVIFSHQSKKLSQRLDRISNCAVTAFALGCAEWTVYSLAKHHNPFISDGENDDDDD